MRELILNDIEIFRSREQNFNKGTMRWDNWWFSPEHGIVRIYSKKEKGKYANLIRLEDTTRGDFNEISDAKLLEAYQLIIRQMSKQM